MSTLTNAPLELPEGLMRSLEAAYRTPPRAYHSFAHVQEVLRHVEAVTAGPGWRQPREIYLAVLFHDAVYRAAKKDNEAKSAQLALDAIATFLPNAGLDAARVAHLIGLTAQHGRLARSTLDDDAAHFVDCDMAILGAAPAAFDAYDAGIAQEYEGAIPGILFRFNRRRFLKHLLQVERIFLSDFFHGRFDAAARANLARALDRA